MTYNLVHVPTVHGRRFRGAWEWRRFMEYFIVTRYKECVSTLTDQDDVAACGTNWVSGWAGLQAVTTAVRQADMRSNGMVC